jgi:hypothetical protein
VVAGASEVKLRTRRHRFGGGPRDYRSSMCIGSRIVRLLTASQIPETSARTCCGVPGYEHWVPMVPLKDKRSPTGVTSETMHSGTGFRTSTPTR